MPYIYQRTGINDNILAQTTVTADTGFANEANMQYLHENEIDAYIPDNQFNHAGRKKSPAGRFQKNSGLGKAPSFTMPEPPMPTKCICRMRRKCMLGRCVLSLCVGFIQVLQRVGNFTTVAFCVQAVHP